MKKHIIILAIAAMTLAGCDAKTELPAASAAPKKAAVVQQATVPTETESIPKETAQPVVEEVATVPTEAIEPPAKDTKSQQAVTEDPPKHTTSTQVTVPAKPPTPTQAAPKPQSTPVVTVPGRKVSSATCKDTGSNKLWEKPDIQKFDPYETTDTERIAYIKYLEDYGKAYGFHLQVYTIEMRVGRIYAMPLMTDADTFKSCTWVSSDPTVATVNSVGTVTPLKAGETTITVKSAQAQITTSCICIVREDETLSFANYTFAQLEKMAHQEAKKIAAYATENGTTDLEKIAIAAAVINDYVAKGNGGSYYGIENGDLVMLTVPGYNQPFGTLITNYSTCAGDTRALGLVLEYMGFEWFHEGENQWDHQWCVVYDVDGQTAFADGSYAGIAGYGERKDDMSNWQQYRDGSLQSFR